MGVFRSIEAAIHLAGNIKLLAVTKAGSAFNSNEHSALLCGSGLSHRSVEAQLHVCVYMGTAIQYNTVSQT